MSKRFYSHKRKWMAWMACFLLVLSGCHSSAQTEKMPFIAPVYPPLQHHLRAALYYALPDGSLTSEIHLIDLDHSISAENGLVKQVIDGPTGNLFPVIDKKTVLNYVYIVEDTAYVDISVSKQQSLVQFSKSCMQSLHDAFDISYIVLTVDGRMPLHAINGIEGLSLQKDDASKYIQLFFPDKRGQYIIPAVRHIAIPSDSDLATAVMDALRNGPVSSDLSAAMDSEGISLTSIRRSGQTLSVYLAVAEQSAIDLQGYSCIAMSMLRNIPNVREVRINMNNTWVRDVPGLNGADAFTIDSISSILGGMIKLYFAGADGASLVAVNRSVPFKEAADPLSAIKEIIRGPLDVEKQGIMNVLPAGIKLSDILTLQHDDIMAILDLKASFYQACSGLSEDAEKLLLYSFVNALTERADIHSVLFLSDGTNAETLSGTVSLSVPLLRNPGLIMQP